jgi:transglutaminase-like putative cysteine protease
MAALAAMGTLMLGVGQRNAALPVLVLLAAAGSVWLTDITGWFRLNRTVAGVAALIATLVSVRNLLTYHGAMQILAMANLLIYLQVILLFQAKDSRTYWQLAMLSFLQVVVAAPFAQGAWFGVMLVGYLFMALSALGLLFLYRESQQHRRPDASLPPKMPASASRRWPLAGQSSELLGTGAAASGAAIGRDFFFRLAWVGLATLLFSAVVFFAVPRPGQTNWRGVTPAPKRLVGYSGRVRLGELGQIIQSTDEVARISFSDLDTGQPYRVSGEVYLHGTAMTHYRNGEWEVRGGYGNRGKEVLEATDAPTPPGLVNQMITMEPLDREEVFCVWPFIALQANEHLIFDHDRQRLLRPTYLADSRFSFSLATSAMRDGVQQALVPADRASRSPYLLSMPPAEGPEAVPGLVALADTWADEAGLPAKDRLGLAQYFERRMALSGRFRYTLDPPVRDPTVDPVEDFVVNHPEGHCEYFATALALMLRSQGVPTRMVIGYKTDQWNQMGRFFQVRQLHAHTWVEAYLRPRDLPRELIRGANHWDWAAGGWLRLDATAPAITDDAPTESYLSPAHRAVLWLDTLWSSYVVEMDGSRQRKAIYRPVVRTIRETWRALTDPLMWQALGRTLLDTLTLRGASLRDWFSWRGAAAAGLAALGVGLLLWLGLRLVRRLLAGPHRADPRRAADAGQVDFYRRLESLLARRGLIRRPGQTQREFADEAAARLRRHDEADGSLQQALDLLVEAFYRVRFGRRTLDTDHGQTVETVEAALATIGGVDPEASSQRKESKR